MLTGQPRQQGLHVKVYMGLTKRLKTRSMNTTMATLIMALPRVSGRLEGGSSGSVPQLNSSEFPELKALAPGRPLQ